MNDLAFSNPVYTRLIAATAERIVEQRLRTAPASSQLSTKLIRNPKHHLHVDAKHAFLFAYPSSDEGNVNKRIRTYGTPVPALFTLKNGTSQPFGIKIKANSFPHLMFGESKAETGKSILALPEGPGTVFGLEPDGELGLTNISIRVGDIGLQYDVPFFICVMFGLKSRVANAAEVLDTMASLMMSRSSPKPEFAVPSAITAE